MNDSRGKPKLHRGASLRLVWPGLAALLSLGGLCRPARGESAIELDRAVRRLGSETFTARHDAGDELIRAGVEALPFLRDAAVNSPSPEVRYRATELLDQIERQVLDGQVSEILNGAEVHSDFPAWNRYSVAIGHNAAARQVFAEMLRLAPDLLLSVGRPGFQDAFERYVGEWLSATFPRGGRALSDIETAALVFAMAQPECQPSAIDAGLIGQHALSGPFQSKAIDGERGPVLRRILAEWVIRSEAGPALTRLRIAENYGLLEGIEPAREILRAPLNGQDPLAALICITRFGGLEDLHDVESLLGDAQELSSSRRRTGGSATEFSTEVRDLALVTLWKLMGENPAEHGFPDYVEVNGRPKGGAVGFRTNDARTKALAEWRNWRKRHAKAFLPPDGNAREGRIT